MGRKREIRRDQAGVGPDPSESRRRLASIDDLDGFKVADGEPDVRGWAVTTLNGRELGAVEDLLIDPERGEVVMLEVALRDEGLHAELPLRHVQLDHKRQVVIVDSGDLDRGTRSDVRARERMGDEDREHVRTTYGSGSRDVRYGESRDVRPDDDGTVIVHRGTDDGDVDRVDDAGRSKRAAPANEPRVDDDIVDETVVDRRPIIEETVVRRRVVDEE
jgi:sporulation protein YlmC with PRC-barrel domain